MDEYVVLVDEKNTVLGTSPKLETHNTHTPLHRGFSLFLFNDTGKLLLQRRSLSKKTWPGVWSNSVCGHPKLEELVEDAAQRRCQFELGVTAEGIQIILPTYRYRFEKGGIVENEICPVMVGILNQQPRENAEEVAQTKWISWKDWVQEVSLNAPAYSEWCVEETHLLDSNKTFREFFKQFPV